MDVLGTIIGRPTPLEQVIVAGDDLVWPDASTDAQHFTLSVEAGPF